MIYIACTTIHKHNFFLIKNRDSGFTLIELSIVLVIIGLIIGGILTGQDLIRSAEIKATIGQVEKYNTAVNTFCNKYRGIPGDLASGAANSFGITNSLTLMVGNGNSVIEGAGADHMSFNGEPVTFWLELSQAGLIDGSYGASATAAGLIAANATTPTLANNYMPPAKLGRGNSISVESGNSENYFLISGFGNGSGITAAGGLYNAQTNNLTPIEASAIDKKVDDGLPGSGSIQAFDSTTPITAATVITTPALVGGCAAGGALPPLAALRPVR